MKKLHILGIGNAIVDVLGYCSDDDLDNRGLQKGGMSLIDEDKAQDLYNQLGQTEEHSGGSAANTIAAIASLGLDCAFIGKVKNDQLGEIFEHDLTSIGVAFSTPKASEGPSTARCLIHVTPDAQRTMATFLGACVTLAPSDIDMQQVKQASITYIEGYLWDSPAAIEAIRQAMHTAREAGNKTAFTLSDTFCVARHREDFLKLAAEVDILFANEAEVMALFETSYIDEALEKLSHICKLAAVTMSEQGVVVITPSERHDVKTDPVAKLVDTTGAGDLFAAGFLYGICKGWTLPECARLGNKTAGYIIQQLGARSLKPLSFLLDNSCGALASTGS